MATPYIAENNKTESSQGRILDVQDVMALIRERIWFGVAVAVLVFCITYIQLKRIEPQYQSTATLMVEAQIPRIMNFQDAMAVNIRNLEYFNTVLNTLHSREIMEKAVTQSGLLDQKNFFPSLTNAMQKASAAKGLVNIMPVEKSRLIKVTARHTDPEVAALLANAVAQAYIQQELDNRMSSSLQALEWLRARSDEYRQKLEEGLNKLQQYREETKSVSLEDDQNIVIEKLKALNGALTAAQTQLIDAESAYNVIKDQRATGQPWIHVASQLNNDNVKAALQAWQRQQQEVSRLRKRYKPDYPDMREALKLEEMLLRQFEVSCSTAMKTLQARYETLKEREVRLKRALEEQEQVAFALDRQLVRYNELKRNVEADREIYQSILAKMKEASVAESLPTEVIRVAERARAAKKPFIPNPSRMMTRGSALGLGAGIAVMVLLYYMDRRFRRSEDAESVLGLPVLVSLPVIERKNLHERGMISQVDPQGAAAEAFKTLRTVVQVMPTYKDAHVYLISSTQPGEGKSLVSTNLAITMAQSGKKTLLVGADLRRPAFKQIFDLERMPLGLSEMLSGEKQWKELVNSDIVQGLDIIASGSIPQNPSELLGNARMTDFMCDVRKEYECVIIDSSPMMGISDALILVEYADAVLFVIRQGVTHSLGARNAVKRMQEGGGSRIGLIMNGVSLNRFKYYYGNYGGYYNYQPPKLLSQEQKRS